MSKPEMADLIPVQKTKRFGKRIINITPTMERAKTSQRDEELSKRRKFTFTYTSNSIGPPIVKTKIKPQDAVAVDSTGYNLMSKTIKTTSSLEVAPAAEAGRKDSHFCDQNFKGYQNVEPATNGSEAGKNFKYNAAVAAKAKTLQKHRIVFSAAKASTSTAPKRSEISSLRKASSKQKALTPSYENSPLKSYKTLDEFLDMAELNPPSNSNCNGKGIEVKSKRLYKSQFWGYLKPYKKGEENRRIKKDKAYDPVEVKSYMEKQKEIRKLKDAREFKDRQLELDRKKKQLQDLNEKCRYINAKRCLGTKRLAPPATTADSQPTPNAQESYKQNHLLFHRVGAEPSQRSLLKPDERDATSDASSPGKLKSVSEQDLQATVLLQEFEHIVKKECMQVLKHHMNKIPGASAASKRPQTYDKASETTCSLLVNENMDARLANSSVPPLPTREVGVSKSKVRYNAAATKIQAAFRGYQTRKILRSSNMLPYLRHKNDLRRRRRISFFRASEKPYDSPIKQKLSCVPTEKTAKIAQELREQSAFGETSIIPTVRKHFMSLNAEPFPKEFIENMQHGLHLNRQSESLQRSNERLENVWPQFGFAMNGERDLVNKSLNVHSQHVISKPLFSTSVQAQLDNCRKLQNHEPTIADVLKEKVRAFSQELHAREICTESFPKRISRVEYSNFDGKDCDRNANVNDVEVEKRPNITTRDNNLGKRMSKTILAPHVPNNNTTEKRKTTKIHKYSQQSKVNRKEDKYDSTTTVDTDIDLLSNSSQEATISSSSLSLSQTPTPTNVEQRTSGTALSTNTNILKSSMNTESLPIPALELCYKAEIERMQILEKGYQYTLNKERQDLQDQVLNNQRLKQENKTKYRVQDFEAAKVKPSTDRRVKCQPESTNRTTKGESEQEKQEIKNNAIQSLDVNLALMNCQKEALHATAEIAKLITDLHKSTVKKSSYSSEQQPDNLASIVYAAVDEARRRDSEKRAKKLHIERRRELKEKKLEKKVEREKLTELSKITPVIYRDEQVQFPSSSSSVCDSLQRPSVQERHDEQHQSRPESFRKSAMESVIKAQDRLEKQLQQTKKLLDDINTDKDIADNLNEMNLLMIKLKSPVGLEQPSFENSNQQSSTDALNKENEIQFVAPITKDDTFNVKVDAADLLPNIENVVFESENESTGSKTISTENEKVLALHEPTQLNKSIEESGILPITFEELHVTSDVDEKSNLIEYSKTSSIEEKTDGSPEMSHGNLKSGESSLSIIPYAIEEEGSLQSEEQIGTKCGTVLKSDEGVVYADSTIISKPPDISNEIIETGKELFKSGAILNAEEDLLIFEEPKDHNEVPDKMSTSENEYSPTSVHNEEMSTTDEHLPSPSFEHDDVDAASEIPSSDVEEEKLEESLSEKWNEEVLLQEHSEEISNIVDVFEIREGPHEEETKYTNKPFVKLDEPTQYNVSFEEPDIVILEQGEESQNANLLNKPDTAVDQVVDVSTDVLYKETDEEFESQDRFPASNENETFVLKESQDKIYSDEENDILNKNEDIKTPEFDNRPRDKEESHLSEIESLGMNIVVDEEEWFEDELITDITEDEALKLEAAKIEEEQSRIENEIRALEALQAQVPPVTEDTTVSASDIPDKPPPPYSPPSAESFTVSSRCCLIPIEENEIQEAIVKQVNNTWDVWLEFNTLGPLSTDIVLADADKSPGDSMKEAVPVSRFRSLQQTGIQSFNSLLKDFVRQTMGELLLVDDGSRSYIDNVRAGPMTLQAQQRRVPKSKNDLVEVLFKALQDNIPSNMISDRNANPSGYGMAWKKRLRKWSSRPRDQVDEVLVEELIQDNTEWTEFWPEELIVVEKICGKTVRRIVQNTLRHIEIVFEN